LALREDTQRPLRFPWRLRVGIARVHRTGIAFGGTELRVRSRQAGALRALLERHGATVSPGSEDGVLLVADLGAARIIQLAAARAIALDEPPTPSR
jgi:hypothetical protein